MDINRDKIFGSRQIKEISAYVPTSILYHAFGLKCIRYKATPYEGEYLIPNYALQMPEKSNFIELLYS